jgi:predicted alpha/beta-fold hydrolase
MQHATFDPHPLLRGAHSQTLTGWLMASHRRPYQAEPRHVVLDDGDQVVLHDDCPQDWSNGDPTVLMLHGLAGCHQSAYMQRIAARLNDLGMRTFRMDLRGAGAGMQLARRPYHAGSSEDAAVALKGIASWCPTSPSVVLGFSLGGAIVLNLLGRCGLHTPGNLIGAAAVCPPIDLRACVERIQTGRNRLYERYFLLHLSRQAELHRQIGHRVSTPQLPRRLRSVNQFDELFTAPASGFRDAQDYYTRCSAEHVISNIRKPTLILASRDDPMIPPEPWQRVSLSSSTRLCLTDHGGHLGFISRGGGQDPDRRWMDWRIVNWVRQQMAAV